MLIKGIVAVILPCGRQQDKTTLNYLEEGFTETNCARKLNRGHQAAR